MCQVGLWFYRMSYVVDWTNMSYHLYLPINKSVQVKYTVYEFGSKRYINICMQLWEHMLHWTNMQFMSRVDCISITTYKHQGIKYKANLSIAKQT